MPAYDRYFEKQTAANCGVHAINNAVGLKLCTVDDLHAVAAFLKHTLCRQTKCAMTFDTASGDFEIDCVQAALLQKGWTCDLPCPTHEIGHVEEGWAALRHMPCLLITSDGPDDLTSVESGCRLMLIDKARERK